MVIRIPPKYVDKAFKRYFYDNPDISENGGMFQLYSSYLTIRKMRRWILDGCEGGVFHDW